MKLLLVAPINTWKRNDNERRVKRSPSPTAKSALLPFDSLTIISREHRDWNP